MKTTPIRVTLFYSYLAVLLLGIGVASIVAWQTVEGLYLDTQAENLLAQARMSAAALEGQVLPENNSQIYNQTTNVMPGIHSRILSEQGGVVLKYPLDDIEVSLPGSEQPIPVSKTDLLERKEIGQALAGEASTAVRTLQIANRKRVLYAAAPIFGEGGGIDGLVYLAMPLPPAGIPADALWKMGVGIFIAIILAILAAGFMSRWLARPIEAVASTALEVSTGNLNQRVEGNFGIKELEYLGRSFNTMTTSLLQSEQAKTAFIADVTHELRTPLTVINGTIETLEDGALDDLEGRIPLLASMKHETERLIRMVNDLLILTRADSGALALDLSAVDMRDLIVSRCNLMTVLATNHGIRIIPQVESMPEVSVSGDADRLAQILDNLLDNAIRYSPQGGTVTVSLAMEGTNLVCRVRDQGSGIAEKDLPYIFDRFFRVERSRNRINGGSGLGLAIVKALMNAHQGQVWVESKLGEGTTISFSIPFLPDGPKKYLN